MKHQLLASAVLLSCGLCGQALAAESYDNCAGYIDTLPATISTQGVWCLRQDVNTALASGAAITIATNNVSVDCNHFKIGGLAAGAGTKATGIIADTRNNATVRNCNVRGFYVGAALSGSGHVIEDNRFNNNTGTGIYVEGDGSVIRRNLVAETGRSSVSSTAAGIVTRFDVDVIDNTVSAVSATTGADREAYGISAADNASGSIRNNRIRNLDVGGAGSSFGIYNAASSHVVMKDNHVIGDGSADSTIGIACTDDSGMTRDNVVNGFQTGVALCDDDGTDVVKL
jgi:parallel beta-helix repeat protein